MRVDRRALTLVEVLLTLSLLVVLAAVTWPLAARPLANERLRRSADGIRAQLIKARVRAMSTGHTYGFCFAPSSNVYMVRCVEAEATVAADASADPSGDTLRQTIPKQFMLPDGIVLLSAAVNHDSQAGLADLVEGTTNPGTAAASNATGSGSGGSAPSGPASDPETANMILLNPDGTTSTARLTLRNEYGRGILIAVRGLTGAVSVSDVINLATL
jgi:Tfp pilus assembly protein FimT